MEQVSRRTRNMFQEQKSSPNTFYEQKTVSRTEKSICKFQGETNQHATSFTNKNPQA